MAKYIFRCCNCNGTGDQKWFVFKIQCKSCNGWGEALLTIDNKISPIDRDAILRMKQANPWPQRISNGPLDFILGDLL